MDTGPVFRIRIRTRGSVTLDFESGSGSRSCSFLQCRGIQDANKKKVLAHYYHRYGTLTSKVTNLWKTRVFVFYFFVDGRIQIRTNIGENGTREAEKLNNTGSSLPFLEKLFFLFVSFIFKHNIYTGSTDFIFLFDFILLFAALSFPILVMGQDRKIPFMLGIICGVIFSDLGDGCHNVHGSGDEITGQSESSVEKKVGPRVKTGADQCYGSVLVFIKLFTSMGTRIRISIESNQC
jgi:hypothetical protein